MAEIWSPREERPSRPSEQRKGSMIARSREDVAGSREGRKRRRYRTPDLLRACSQAKARRQQNGAAQVPRRGASSGYAATDPRGTRETRPVLRLGPLAARTEVAASQGQAGGMHPVGQIKPVRRWWFTYRVSPQITGTTTPADRPAVVPGSSCLPPPPQPPPVPARMTDPLCNRRTARTLSSRPLLNTALCNLG